MNTNLIAISGKAGSGKDLVGQIIQYIIYKKSLESGTITDVGHSIGDMTKYGEFCSGWKVVKFADKLKDCVCLILGCTREEIEDREFKETLLGDEWQGYQISWDVPSGQWEGLFNTGGDALDYLKDNGLDVNSDYTYTDGIDEELIRKIELTPRKILQLLGTECGRNIIHPNIWVNSTFSDFKPFAKIPNHPYTLYPSWIITDVRFPNEVERIHKEGGIVIRIHRDIPNQSNHISETMLDGYTDFDYTIENDGTIDELVEKIRLILETENVI
jgi:hypothetical protein